MTRPFSGQVNQGRATLLWGLRADHTQQLVERLPIFLEIQSRDGVIRITWSSL